ncbi:hypothetical protein DRJ12_01615 [Candidatus Acetothermia bacterium]|nr:MAG: hypothetical protein DRJ12_01615 [Candidatus Acetothermia bacterium]
MVIDLPIVIMSTKLDEKTAAPASPANGGSCPLWRWISPLVSIASLSSAAGGSMMLAQLYLKTITPSPVAISLLTSFMWLGTLIGSGGWGTLADRYPKRMLLGTILGMSALATASLGILLPVPGVLTVAFIRVLMVSGISPIALAIISAHSTMANRGRNMSYFTSSQSLGSALGSITAGFLLAMVGYRYGFIALAGLPLVAMLLVPSIPRTEAAVQARVKRVQLIKRNGLSGLYVGSILRQMGTTGSASLIYVYMATLGIPAGTMGTVNAVSPITSILGMPLFGRLADRVGRRAVFCIGFGLSALVPLVFAMAKSAWVMVLGYMTLGIAFSSLYTGSAAYIGDRIPVESQGAMLGLFDSSRGLGGVLGPLVAGAITPVLGFRGMFLTMSGIAAIGFILVGLRTRAPAQSS